jgi:hypothetical protein
MIAACGPPPPVEEVKVVDKGKGQITEEEPWEIIYTRSLTTDTGDCSNLEHMDTEMHIAPQGINVYALHYTENNIENATKKLVRTVFPEDEPAATLIKTVEANRYYEFKEHATYALGPNPPDDCSDESESVTILTPATTAIVNLEFGPENPPPEGVFLEIYELLNEYL